MAIVSDSDRFWSMLLTAALIVFLACGWGALKVHSAEERAEYIRVCTGTAEGKIGKAADRCLE